MAIKFDLFENPVKEGVSVPKLHAKVVTKDVVTTREIREAIRRKCTVSPADVAAVITALNDVWGIERSGFFNGREKWAKGFENQRV